MKTQLSLRQSKILQILRNRDTYITSDEIAKILYVSSKTVRADISDINDSLSSDGIRIDSIKSKGFILYAKDLSVLNSLYKDHNVFMSRDDRIFYLATLLCSTYDPVDLYDLEDEMAVSSSTLTGDITAFKKRFVQNVPYIEMISVRDTIRLEEDERKRRFILTKLLSDNWDYSSTGSTYYKSDIVDSDAFRIINPTVGKNLFRHGILLDDYNLIYLILYIAITFHKLKNGCVLNAVPDQTQYSDDIVNACADIFDELEDQLDFRFPDSEISEVCRIISESCFRSGLNNENQKYDEKYHEIVDKYLDRILDIFQIDLKDDEEFRDKLLAFTAQLFRPMKDLTVRDTPDSIKMHLFVECDVAFLFHRIVEKECNITENDLLYLSTAVYGAFFNHFVLHPEDRYKTVVLCHMGSQTMWSLKLSLHNLFGGYLNIADVIPVHHKDYYDFSDTDLVLSTVDKKVTGEPIRNVVNISPYLTRDNSYAIVNQIRDLKIHDLYPDRVISMTELLENAFVHEGKEFSSQYSLIEYMCNDFIESGIFNQDHMFAILKKEAVSSFAFTPAALLLYSMTPGTQTKLSVLTLDRPITWNKYKIRIVFMVSLKKEDMRELFYIQNIIFHRCYNPEIMKNLKTIEEIKEYFQEFE